MDQLLSVKKDEWKAELDDQAEFFTKFGDRLPSELQDQLNQARSRFGF